MAISADVLRNHLEYTAWASKRLVDTATGISPEELTRDFQTADHSVVGTLAHIYAADRIWLARVTNATPGAFISDADRTLSVLVHDWPALLDRWRKWAQALTDESAAALITYKDLKGNEYTQPLWQIVVHVVNHGTHHRGQVSGFLRAMGYPPPPLDAMAFYRAQAAARA
ncbi:MAG TPA: DinB family protein [Bryobacteraceae bacterium]|nr:DinB family protein [Bryobacteraceae bacterium]